MTNIEQLPDNYGKGEYETENRTAFINYFPVDSKKVFFFYYNCIQVSSV